MNLEIINIKNISFSYEKSSVLINLSFCIKKNSFFVIIGPNGSGKSTLLKIISGLLKPQAGQVSILDKPVSGYSKKALAKIIALVPQKPVIDFPFSVLDIVMMGRSPHLGLLGFEKEYDYELAKKALEFTGVDHLADRGIDKLSGGEQQRVFIARAICQAPQIILLDEPTASLDLANQVKIMDLMEKLKKEKDITVVMVSHDINLAAMYGDELLLLSKGEIVNIGQPNDVINYKTLEDIYGCKLLVDESPLGNYPRITLVPKRHLISAVD